MEKDKAPKTVAVGRIVINSIRKLQGKDGVSLPALKKFLRDAKNIDTAVHDAEIKLTMKSAIDRGLLVKEARNYKVKEPRRRRSRSKSRSKSSPKQRETTTSSRKKRSRRKKSGSKKRSSTKKRSGTKKSSRRHSRGNAVGDPSKHT